MEDSHKEAAISFLQLAASGKVREAYSKFVGSGFRHHNPYFEGSAETLMAGMEENARQNPNKVLEVKRTIAEGEFLVIQLVETRTFGSGVVYLCYRWADEGR